MSTEKLSSQFNILKEDFDLNKETDTFIYSLFKDQLLFYNDSIIVNLVSAEYLNYTGLISTYYNSNFSIQNLISEFNWSNNINEKIILTNNNYLNNISISSTIQEFKQLNQNNNVSVSACTLNRDKNYLFLASYYNIITAYYPKFISTNKIYYPYRADYLLLKDYLYFEENSLFGNYLDNTMISSTIISCNTTYNNIQIIGASNNNTSCIFNKKENLIESLSFNADINYNFNYQYDIFNTAICQFYPVNTIFISKIFLVQDNNYTTFMKYITDSNNLSCCNCSFKTINIENLSTELLRINRAGEISSISAEESMKLLSSNYFQVHFDTIALTSLFYNTTNNQLINSHILNCLYLHDYTIINNKTFYLPAFKNNEIKYNISLYNYLINPGYNDIFDFNIVDNNFNNINILPVLINQNIQISSNIISTIISTSIKNENYIAPYISSNYIIKPILWKIQNNQHIILQNELSTEYSFYDLLSAQYCIDINNNNYNINNLQNTILYLSAGTTDKTNALIIHDKININDDSLYIHDFNDLKYRPIVQYSYPAPSNIFYQTPIQNHYYGNQQHLNISIIGKYINRLQNNLIYIYYNSETYKNHFNNNNFIISASMLYNNYIPEFIDENIIITLSDNITLTQTIKSKLKQTIVSGYIVNNMLNIYNYSALTNILNNIVPTSLSYYHLIDNIYLYIPTYFIGSIKTDKFNVKNDKIYNLQDKISANINPSTYCFDFTKTIQIPYDSTTNIATLSISDFNSNTSLLFKPICFNSKQYIDVQDEIIYLNQSKDTIKSYNIINIPEGTENYNIYFDKDLQTNYLYYTYISGLVNLNNNEFNYGGTIYSNATIKFTYLNNLRTYSTNQLSALYVAYIPNISAETVSSTSQEGETTITYNYYYPTLSTDYYISNVISLSSTVTSAQYYNMFKYTIKHMYTSLSDIIINNYHDTLQIQNTLSCYYNKTSKTFSYIYLNNTSEQQTISNKYINLYFTTTSKNKIGIFTLFIQQNN